MLIPIRSGDKKFPQLKGRENYMAWKIHMRSLLKDADIWQIVEGEAVPILIAGTSTPQGTVQAVAVTQADIENWNKRRQFALGEIQRRCDAGPLAHIADTTDPKIAWDTLQTMFENIGTAAMTVLHQRFFGARMKEGDSIEEHIRNMRKLQDQINLAIQEQGGDKIKELQFIRQVVTSLPDSWDTFVSILDFDFDNMADAGGLQMSKKVQNKLLAEDMRRKAKSGDSAFFASTSQNRQSSSNCFFNQ